MFTPEEIRSLADKLRRFTPGADPHEVAAYARKYKGWSVTDDEVRDALTTR